MTFLSVLAPVEDDMRRLDRLIGERLESDVPLVRQVAEYIVAAGGKRLPPALLLLASGAPGYRGEARLTPAAAVGSIHPAPPPPRAWARCWRKARSKRGSHATAPMSARRSS